MSDYKGRLGTAALILDRVIQAWNGYIGEGSTNARDLAGGDFCPRCGQLQFGDKALDQHAREVVRSVRQAREFLAEDHSS